MKFFNVQKTGFRKRISWAVQTLQRQWQVYWNVWLYGKIYIVSKHCEEMHKNLTIQTSKWHIPSTGIPFHLTYFLKGVTKAQTNVSAFPCTSFFFPEKRKKVHNNLLDLDYLRSATPIRHHITLEKNNFDLASNDIQPLPLCDNQKQWRGEDTVYKIVVFYKKPLGIFCLKPTQLQIIG